MDDLLARSAAELFARHCDGEAVRRIRAGGPAEALWSELESSGFADALVPEQHGGAGLRPAGALPVLLCAGRFAAPVPLGDTMLARAVLALSGEEAPAGPVVLAEPLGGGRGRVRFSRAAWALLPGEDGARLLPLAEAVVEDEVPDGRVLRWDGDAGRAVPGGWGVADWRAAGAWVEASLMAGAMERAMEDAVRHARDRQQFGRPVSAFQAVQQQMSVLCEDVFAARIAAQLASVADGGGVCGLDAARVAAAKLRIGEAAARVSSIAHAVHGAMGITAEVDLHLLTEQMQRGRGRFGSEGHWAALLGRDFLRGNAGGGLDFVRDRIAPVEEASA